MDINIDNLHIILGHYYENALQEVEELLGEEFPLKLDDAIQYCEDNNFTHFEIYNLMLLKKDLQKLNKKDK